MLQYKGISVTPDGRITKIYTITQGFTACDCLKALIRNEDVVIRRGRRSTEAQDVPPAEYESLDEFFASGDFDFCPAEESAPVYTFFGFCGADRFSVVFSHKNNMLLHCTNGDLDLIQMING